MRRNSLPAVVGLSALTFVCAAAQGHAAGFAAGVGFSATGDVTGDCQAAVRQALRNLEGGTPKFVTCYYSHEREIDQVNGWKPEEVDTRAWTAAREACPADVVLVCIWNKGDYVALTSAGGLEKGGRGSWVLALGGDMDVRPRLVRLSEASRRTGRFPPLDYVGLGKKVSEDLPPRPGKTNLLWMGGNLHHPINPGITVGLTQGYGKTFPVFAGASSVNSPVVWEGAVLQECFVAVMLSGDFHLTMAGMGGNAGRPGVAVVVEQYRRLFDRLKAGARGKPEFLFLYPCVGWQTDPQQERAFTAEYWGDLPFFGFYSGGETGKYADDLPASGGAGCAMGCLISE